jgi:hypothetical protein
MANRVGPRRYWFLKVVPVALVLLLVANSVPNGWPAGLRTFGLSAVVALAAGAAGGLVGFLFGIPVRWTQERAEAEGSGTELPYRGNTSLEQISDWLVKILVGVGLAQLTAAGPALVSSLT